MTNVRRRFAWFSGLLTLLLLPVTAHALPALGSNELRIDGRYLMPGFSVVGFNHNSVDAGGSSTNSTNSQTTFGLGFAYGRFLTDNLEIGTSLTFTYLSSDSGLSNTSMTIPGLAPFVRLFAPISERVAVFGTGIFGYQHGSQDSSYSSGGTSTSKSTSTINEWEAGVDLGIEFFPADSWSLRIGPTYRYLHISTSSSNSSSSTTSKDNAFGINWALAGYF